MFGPVNSTTISNNSINTFVDETEGTGQLVDAIKTTGYNDVVINNGSTGVVVDLGGTNYEWEHTSESDTFIGSASSNYDVLDAEKHLILRLIKQLQIILTHLKLWKV